MRPERRVSLRALFAVVYATSISSLYFALGVIGHHANGLTPEVFLVAGVFFQLTAMTYAEGASLRPERGGSATFARHAFNELVSFIAGWAIVLDYIILVAVAAISVPAYLSVFWAPLGHGTPLVAVAAAVIVLVAVDNLRGITARRLRRRILATGIDLVLQVAVIVVGLALAFHPGHLSQAVHLGSAPSGADLAFALPVAVVAFTGLEAAAALSSETSATPRQVGRLVGVGSAAIVLVWIGIAVVGIGALPVHHGVTDLGRHHVKAPILGLVEAFPGAAGTILKYVVGILGALGLTSAAGAAMLGVARSGYSLATNRQIPSAVGRLSQRWGTPWVLIAFATAAAIALAVPADLEALIGIYAFGALVAFTIAHLSVVRMRVREPARERGYRVPLSLPVGGGVRVPLPGVLGAVLSVAGWIALIVFHTGARYVGVGWLLFGVVLYVIYRTTQGKPLLRRVSVPERALRHEPMETEFGSILVPIFGTPLDDDSIQTAGRLAGETQDDVDAKGATIEAVWVQEVPMSLPLDAPLPTGQIQDARRALARAKQVGEEYEDVEVATALVRARRAGHGIVSEARRRGVELIVLSAEEPPAIRGGGLLGGRAPLENYVGEAAKYVMRKAPCRVILTAPPADWRRRFDSPGHESQPSGPEYESVLVVFDESGFSPEVMATAALMAARRGRTIHVLVTIRVPAAIAIDAAMPREEALAETILEEARVQSGRRVTGRWVKVRAGQAGRRIVDEARALRAEAIVMPAPQAGSGLGRTHETVLRERPCRLIIESTSARAMRPRVAA